MKGKYHVYVVDTMSCSLLDKWIIESLNLWMIFEVECLVSKSHPQSTSSNV
jgi:hypothetical protein